MSKRQNTRFPSCTVVIYTKNLEEFQKKLNDSPFLRDIVMSSSALRGNMLIMSFSNVKKQQRMALADLQDRFLLT